MNIMKKLFALTLLFTSACIITGCSDNNAEDTGEKIDEMATDAGNAVEDACEDVKEGVDAEDKDC